MSRLNIIFKNVLRQHICGECLQTLGIGGAKQKSPSKEGLFRFLSLLLVLAEGAEECSGAASIRLIPTASGPAKRNGGGPQATSLPAKSQAEREEREQYRDPPRTSTKERQLDLGKREREREEH